MNGEPLCARELLAEVLEVTGLSLGVAMSATVIAAVIGLPLAFLLAERDFPGRRLIVTLIQSLVAVPSVVVGVSLYLILSHAGPLGSLRLLFTPQAIVIGDVLLALPVIASIAAGSLVGGERAVRQTARSLGARGPQLFWTVVREGRSGIVAAVMNGFGRVIAEVGSAMIVGGNIRGLTRTMTTGMALDVSKGEFAFAVATGGLLLVIALGVNLTVRLLAGGDDGIGLRA